MPSKKPTSSAQRQPSLRSLLLAAGLVLLGLIVLAIVTNIDDSPESISQDSGLEVIEGTGNNPSGQQSQTSQRLQNAAKTSDFIQGEEGDNVQPGTSVDELLKDKEL